MCPLHIDLFVKGVPQKVREISRDCLPSHLPQSKSLPYLSPYSATGGIPQLPWVSCSRAQTPLHREFHNIQLQQVQKGEDQINFQLEMKDNRHLPTRQFCYCALKYFPEQVNPVLLSFPRSRFLSSSLFLHFSRSPSVTLFFLKPAAQN